MNKKLMLLAAGVLTALAFSALPSVASAGEYLATCKIGGVLSNECEGTIESTGNATLQDDSGGAAGRVTCTKTTGTVKQLNGKTTNTSSLTFTGCTSNGFSCNSTGQPTGTIITGNLTGDIVNIEPALETAPGLLLTNISVTFACAGGLVKKTVTGAVIGELEQPYECGVFRSHHTVQFTEKTVGSGIQTPQQVTTAGSMFDLTVNNDAGGAYTTASQTGTAHINWAVNQTVAIDC